MAVSAGPVGVSGGSEKAVVGVVAVAGLAVLGVGGYLLYRSLKPVGDAAKKAGDALANAGDALVAATGAAKTVAQTAQQVVQAGGNTIDNVTHILQVPTYATPGDPNLNGGFRADLPTLEIKVLNDWYWGDATRQGDTVVVKVVDRATQKPVAATLKQCPLDPLTRSVQGTPTVFLMAGNTYTYVTKALKVLAETADDFTLQATAPGYNASAVVTIT